MAKKDIVLKGRVTDEHDEHVIVASTLTIAFLIAGLEALFKYEGKLLSDAEKGQLMVFADILREGLAAGVEERKTEQEDNA